MDSLPFLDRGGRGAIAAYGGPAADVSAFPKGADNAH